MLQAAIQEITCLAENSQIGQKVIPEISDSRVSRVLVNNGRHAKPEIVAVPKEIFERRHQFTDLDSFLAFLNRPDVGRTGFAPDELVLKKDHPGLVFICDGPQYEEDDEEEITSNSCGEIVATLLYGHPLTHTATLPILESEEFTALKNLGEGVTQKNLWRALITTLDGKVDPLLILQISSLGVKVKDDREFTIQPAGLTQGKAENAIILSVLNPASGEQSTKIQTNWIFNIRLWDCFDQVYPVRTVLEVVPGTNGLFFQFHAVGMPDVLRQARKDLVEKINAALPANFKAYAGQYGSD